MKLAIFGSAVEVTNKKTKELCKEIAKQLVENNVTVLTGVAVGIPHLIVEEVHRLGGNTVGYSPDVDENNHKERGDNADLTPFNTVHFINGFTKRSLQMIEDADAVIAFGGRMGTLSEVCIAYEENKPIGIVTSLGGVSKHIQHIVQLTKKHRPIPIYYGKNAKNVIEKLISKKESLRSQKGK